MWNRNFIMVVVGQIISLFGNAILRFALPLYLLNETESAALFGVVTACAFNSNDCIGTDRRNPCRSCE